MLYKALLVVIYTNIEILGCVLETDIFYVSYISIKKKKSGDIPDGLMARTPHS